MKERIWIIARMIIVAAVFGSVVSGIYLGSRETLERNRIIRLQRAYAEVFGYENVDEMTDAEITELVDSRVQPEAKIIIDPESAKEFSLIKAYETGDLLDLKGVGFRFRGLGFWAPIEGILALTPDLQKTLDIVILEQQETPGLGGRIEEKIFTAPFEAGLDVSKPEKAGKWLEISASAPSSGSPMQGRHVDAITGATQTSMAMERILNEHLGQFYRAMKKANTEMGNQPLP
ncbi:MAG: FMN-binding protein [Lentisphaeria bacterium]